MAEQTLDSRTRWQWALLTGLMLLGVYGATISFDVAWYDSAEMVVCALRLDIPHQPGYPLFTLLAHVFLMLTSWMGEGWSAAARFSLMCGLSTAVAFTLFCAFASKHLKMPPQIAAFAMVSLGLTPLVWGTSIVSEVYTFELLLVAIALWVTAWALERDSTLSYLLCGLVVGSCVAHRPSSLALVPAAIALVGLARLGRLLSDEKALSRVGSFFGGFVVAFSPYIFVYMRLGAADLVVADPATPKSFWTVVEYWRCTDYGSALFVFGPHELLVRLGHLMLCIASQFPLPNFVFVAIGLHWLNKNSSRLGTALALIVLANASFIVSYNAMEADTMLLPTLLALALAAGVGAWRVYVWSPHSTLIYAGLAALCLWSSLQGYYGVDWTRLQGSSFFAARVSSVIAKGGQLIVSNDVSYRPFLYQRFVRRQREDLAITVIDQLDESNWPQLEKLVRTKGLSGPLLHPANLYGEFRKSFYLKPLGAMYRVLPRAPSFICPPQESAPIPMGIRFGKGLTLDGWSVGIVGAAKPVPGSYMFLKYYWSTQLPLERDLLAVVLFCNELGDCFSDYGACVFHNVHEPCHGYRPTSTWQAKERYVEEHLVLIPEDLPLGGWHVWVAVVAKDDPALKAARLFELSGVNYLNYDGFEQVFRLHRAQRIGEPYWAIGQLSSLERAGCSLLTARPGASKWLRVGTISVESRVW